MRITLIFSRIISFMLFTVLRSHKTVQLKTGPSSFGGRKTLPDRPCFFSEPRREKQETKICHTNPDDTMCVSDYGSFFCLWAVRAQSTARVDRIMGDAAYDWLHRNRAGG